MTGWRKLSRLITVVAVVVVIAGSVWLVLGGRDEAVATDEVIGGIAITEVTAADLAKVSRTKVFFGHQSVGFNILEGVPAVFGSHNVTAPTTVENRDAPGISGGFVAHAQIGANYKPLDKIKDFDTLIRGGLGKQIDVAVMKLCYIDISPSTNVEEVFASYRDTIAALERDFPDVTFIKATVPLTTKPGRLATIKQWVKGNDLYGAASNEARERLNQLIRKEYGGGRLFDVAAVQSTAADGARVGGTVDGKPYFALSDAYASDDGHLNEVGAKRAAAAWLAVIAQASANTCAPLLRGSAALRSSRCAG